MPEIGYFKVETVTFRNLGNFSNENPDKDQAWKEKYGLLNIASDHPINYECKMKTGSLNLKVEYMGIRKGGCGQNRGALLSLNYNKIQVKDISFHDDCYPPSATSIEIVSQRPTEGRFNSIEICAGGVEMQRCFFLSSPEVLIDQQTVKTETSEIE
jgi:hypothetical protein